MGDIKDKFQFAKEWWQSRTMIIAGIVAISSITKMLWGFDLGVVIDMIWGDGEVIAGEADSIWMSVQALTGSIGAMFYRYKAVFKLK